MQHLVVTQLSEHIRLTRQRICWTATLMITQCYGWKNAGCWRSIMKARIGLVSRTAFFFFGWETHIMTLGSELACQPNKTCKRLPNLDRTTQMIERLIKPSTPHRYFFSNQLNRAMRYLFATTRWWNDICLRKKYLTV